MSKCSQKNSLVVRDGGLRGHFVPFYSKNTPISPLLTPRRAALGRWEFPKPLKRNPRCIEARSKYLNSDFKAIGGSIFVDLCKNRYFSYFSYTFV